MPDPKLPDVPSSWSEFLKQVKEIVVLIAAIIAAVSGTFAGCQSEKNAETITVAKREVLAKADDAAVKANEAKEVVERHATKADGRLKNIEAKIK